MPERNALFTFEADKIFLFKLDGMKFLRYFDDYTKRIFLTMQQLLRGLIARSSAVDE